MQSKKPSLKKKRRFALVLSFGLMLGASGSALAQNAPPTPPPAPPSPGEVLDKINPFKKKTAPATKADAKDGKATGTPAAPPAGGPPPPPDPFKILRRKNNPPANAPVQPPAPPKPVGQQ